jgi:hypothetical protein
MKFTLSTILNIVLVIAVGVLFYLHFASPASSQTAVAGGAKQVPAGSFKIAYFETDSIQNHFDYYKEIVAELDAKNQANSKVLGELKGVFASKYQDLQKVAQTLHTGRTRRAPAGTHQYRKRIPRKRKNDERRNAGPPVQENAGRKKEN